MTLPELRGTPKQIPWANALRQTVVVAMEKHRRDLDATLVDRYVDPTLQELLERQDELFEKVLAHDEASWWIERRNWTLYLLTLEAAEHDGH